jgi:hypothetical protein
LWIVEGSKTVGLGRGFGGSSAEAGAAWCSGGGLGRAVEEAVQSVAGDDDSATEA